MIGAFARTVLLFLGATGLAVLLMAGYLVSQGKLSKEKVARMLAVAYDLELPPPKVQEDPLGPGPSLEELEKARAVRLRTLELRQNALDQQALRLQVKFQQLREDQEAQRRASKAFQQQLQQWESGQKAEAVAEAVALLGSLKPAQAKDQLLRAWNDDNQDWVVEVLRRLPPAKRAKIVVSFKTEEEAATLYQIIEKLRSGQRDQQLAEEIRQLARPQ